LGTDVGKKPLSFEDVTSDLEFFVVCPNCQDELTIEDLFARIRCPSCGWEFKPRVVLARHGAGNNPSMRGFKMRKESHGKK